MEEILGGGPGMKETIVKIVGVAARVSEEVQRDLRNMILRDLAVREFTCPKCGATPTFNCKAAYSFLGLVRIKTPHDARLTAALLVYGDSFTDMAMSATTPPQTRTVRGEP
jgi:hypothetical protein